MIDTSSTVFLTRPGGRVAYDVAGDGPLVILVPGVGDLRSSYRFVTPSLREAGYRVACTDMRGHGESDTTFASYGDEDTAEDITALISEIGGPAVVVGNSMGGGAAVIAAAEHPELVRGIVLIGPFVRNPPAQSDAGENQDAPVIDADWWKPYLTSLYVGRHPDDFDEYVDAVVGNLRRPGYSEVLATLLTTLDHSQAERRLSRVTAPTLVVMGEHDPDFANAVAEAKWIAAALHGEAAVVPDAGHYPQSQQPERTTEAVLTFLKSLDEWDSTSP